MRMRTSVVAVSLLAAVIFSLAGCGGGSGSSGGASVAGSPDAGTVGAGGTAGSGGTAAGGGSASGTTAGTGATDTGTGTGTATGVAKLSWGAAQGGAVGYRVYYGTASGSYATKVDVGLVQTYSLSNLPSGTYYFAVTAYDATGYESALSNEVSKTIG